MEHYLSTNKRTTKEVDKHRKSSWGPDTKFHQEKPLQQSENNLLKVGVRTQWIQWKCPPKVSLRNEWLVASGEKSVELEVQKQRVKSVAEQSYVHPCTIPPNPSIELDMCDQTRDDINIFHVPLIQEEELEEGEILPECKSCASSKPDAKESSSSIPTNTITSGIGLASIAKIYAFAKSVKSDLIDPDLLTMFLCNPQLVDQLMKGQATSPEPETMPKPKLAEVQSMPRISSSTGSFDERRTLPHVRTIPNMAGLNPLPRAEHSPNMSVSKEQLKMLVNKYGTQESVGPSPSTKINRVVYRCKFFNSSKGCRNGSKCCFQHDVEAPNAKRRKR